MMYSTEQLTDTETGAVYPCDFCGGDATFTRVYTERGFYWWLEGVNGSGMTHTELWCASCIPSHALAASKGAN
jgi:hypothetical protein